MRIAAIAQDMTRVLFVADADSTEPITEMTEVSATDGTGKQKLGSYLKFMPGYWALVTNDDQEAT